MDTDAVRHINDPLYEKLRSEDIDAFNTAKSRLTELPSLAHGCLLYTSPSPRDA